jgi:hypothetical protein
MMNFDIRHSFHNVFQYGKSGLLDPERTVNIVNENTEDAQTTIENYKGKTDIEVLCQIYDECVNSFNSAMNVLNTQTGKELQADNSNLVAMYLKMKK